MFENKWARLSTGFICAFMAGAINVHQTRWLKFIAWVSAGGKRLFTFYFENWFRQLGKMLTHNYGHILDLGLTDKAEGESVRVLHIVMYHRTVRFTLVL